MLFLPALTFYCFHQANFLRNFVQKSFHISKRNTSKNLKKNGKFYEFWKIAVFSYVWFLISGSSSGTPQHNFKVMQQFRPSFNFSKISHYQFYHNIIGKDCNKYCQYFRFKPLHFIIWNSLIKKVCLEFMLVEKKKDFYIKMVICMPN